MLITILLMDTYHCHQSSVKLHCCIIRLWKMDPKHSCNYCIFNYSDIWACILRIRACFLQSRIFPHIMDMYAHNRGFAGRPPELKWLLTSPIFSGFSRFFRHFEGQRYRTFYSKSHRHYCDLNANQVCYTFRYVLSYFHNENELTELKRFISGRNSIFVYKLQYILTSKMADFILLTWLQLRKN